MRDHGRCKFTTYCKYNHRKVTDTVDNATRIADIDKEVGETKLNWYKTKKPEHVEKAKEHFETLERS